MTCVCPNYEFVHRTTPSGGRQEHATTVCFLANPFEPLLSFSNLNRTRAVTMCMRLGQKECQGDHEFDRDEAREGGQAL